MNFQTSDNKKKVYHSKKKSELIFKKNFNFQNWK